MSTCLVTNLKTSVSDNNLMKVGETRIGFKSAGDGLMISKGGNLRVISGSVGVGSDDNLMNTASPAMPMDRWTMIKALSPDTVISLSNKYEITLIQRSSSYPSSPNFYICDDAVFDHYYLLEPTGEVNVDLMYKPWGYCPIIDKIGFNSDTPLYCSNLSFEGFNIRNLPALKTFSVYTKDSGITVDQFASHTGLDELLFCMSDNVSGDLMDFMRKWASMGVRSKEIHFQTPISTTANGVSTGYRDNWYGRIDESGVITLEKR